MAKINYIITPQSFEIIRDTVGAILNDELVNQFSLTSDSNLNIKVTVENKSPNDFTEFPLINVSVITGEYSNKNQGSSDGEYQVSIDVYTNSATTTIKDGAEKATLQLQKIIGLCRYILEDPQYKTLGFSLTPTPFILRTMVKSIDFKEIQQFDLNNVAMGRITFNVTANESNKLIIPNLIAGFKTTVNLGDTGNGYLYTS